MSEEFCTYPGHLDSWSWGHDCYGRHRTQRPAPPTDGGFFGYIASAKALIVDFELGDPDDEALVTEVSEAIAGAILDLGADLKRECAADARP